MPLSNPSGDFIHHRPGDLAPGATASCLELTITRALVEWAQHTKVWGNGDLQKSLRQAGARVCGPIRNQAVTPLPLMSTFAPVAISPVSRVKSPKSRGSRAENGDFTRWVYVWGYTQELQNSTKGQVQLDLPLRLKCRTTSWSPWRRHPRGQPWPFLRFPC